MAANYRKLPLRCPRRKFRSLRRWVHSWPRPSHAHHASYEPPTGAGLDAHLPRPVLHALIPARRPTQHRLVPRLQLLRLRPPRRVLRPHVDRRTRRHTRRRPSQNLRAIRPRILEARRSKRGRQNTASRQGRIALREAPSPHYAPAGQAGLRARTQRHALRRAELPVDLLCRLLVLRLRQFLQAEPTRRSY